MKTPLTLRKTAAFAGVAFAFVVLLSTLAGEALVRSLKPQMTYSRLQVMVGDQYVPGDFIPFTLKANYRARMPSMESPGHMVSVSTNDLGLRGAEISEKKPPGVTRILVLGDSYTFGLYCEDHETYPAVLERLYAAERSPVQVINAGYAAGASPDEYYAWLMRRGLSFQPDVVVYGFFVGNDIAGINAGGWSELDAAGLPRKVSDPDLWIDEYGRLRSRVNDWKTVGHEWVFGVPVLRESHLLILLNRAVLRMADPNYENNGWGANPFSMILSAQTPLELRQREQHFFRLIEGMHREAAARGARFLLLMIPVNFQVEPHFLPRVMGTDGFSIQRNYFEDIQPRLRALGIDSVDLLAPMKAQPDRHFFPRNGEVHFNATGNAFAAGVIKDHLDLVPWPAP
jgi:hypothetical protein